MNHDAERSLRAQVKQALRERMRRVRHVLPPEAAAARSARLCERLWALPELQAAALIVGYRAVRKEADVAALLARAEQAGKRVGLPRVHDDTGLALHLHRAGQPLEESGYGIEEPLASAEGVPLDAAMLILVPALAIDVRGHRVGYGRGYYDRLLPQLPRAYKVAVGYDFQLASELPEAEHDVAVDCVVTDERTLRIAG
jgi:5-formyltetrahydrofolate cyclo-ligase